MARDLKPKILHFLYEQVNTNKIPQIKKGMVEEFEAFIEEILTLEESDKIAEKMQLAQANKELQDNLESVKSKLIGEKDEQSS